MMITYDFITGEGMRKPVCLAIIAISIVVAGASLGVTLTRYLGVRAYTPKGTAQAAPVAGSPGVSAAPPAQWTNLFAPGDGMKLASRLPAVKGKGGEQATRSAFVLIGTIVSSSPSARRAILWAAGMKLPKAFREKEEVEPGATLASVERDKVWIARGKEREQLDLLPVGSKVRAAAAAGMAGVPSVGGAESLPTLPADVSSLQWAAPVVAAPGKSSVPTLDGRHLSAREKRRRPQGLRR